MNKKFIAPMCVMVALTLAGCASGKQYESVGTKEPSEVAPAASSIHDPRKGWVNVYSTTEGYGLTITKMCDGANLIYRSVEQYADGTSISVLPNNPACSE